MQLFLIFIFIFGIDQFSKFYILQNGAYQLNTGFALSMFRDQAIFFHLIFFLVTELMLWQIVKKHGAQARMWFTIITSAGFSNVFDRVVRGGVVDFLPIPGLNITNNLADWFITFGVIGLILTLQMKNLTKKRDFHSST